MSQPIVSTPQAKTTAELRKLAKEAESNLNWQLASELWQKAIDSYPQNLRQGQLYENDIRYMRGQVESCKFQSQNDVCCTSTLGNRTCSHSRKEKEYRERIEEETYNRVHANVPQSMT